MKPAELRSPAPVPPRPLARISPSKYTHMLVCPLNAVWSGGKDSPALVRTGSASELGSAVHSLIDLAVKGTLARKNCQEELLRFILKREEQLAANPLTAWMVPLADTVPRHDVRILLAVGMAERLRDKQSAGGTAGAGTSQAEVWVETLDGLIGGRIDQISGPPDSAVIRDFKTGMLLDDSGQAKDEYQNQLKLYAAIHADKFGHWPVRLELVPLEGNVVEVEFSATECTSMLDEARVMLRETNKLIANGQINELAKPSPDACRFCGYRPVCAHYKTRSGVKADGDWPMDIEGRILGTSSHPGFMRLTIEPSSAPGGSITLRVPPSVDLQYKLGEAIGFYSLRKWQNEPSQGFFIWAMKPA